MPRANMMPSTACDLAASLAWQIPLADMEFDAESDSYTYPCPCGDLFAITLVRDCALRICHRANAGPRVCSCQDELRDGEEVGRCPSCSLIIRILYDPETLEATLDALHSPPIPPAKQAPSADVTTSN